VFTLIKLRWSMLAVCAMLIVLAFSTSVFAFTDLKGDPAEAKINALKEAGIISGAGGETFAPKSKITLAQGVHLIVKGLKLNIDNMRFIKEPKASDYFTKVPDHAWYAQDFIIAHLNGLPLDKNADPGAAVTREQYARLLWSGILRTGEYAVIQSYIMFTDEKEVSLDAMDSIQTLLKLKIASLDAGGKFYPKKQVTRSEAADMLYNAIEFVKSHKPAEVKPTPTDSNVTVTEEKVTDDVKKVVLSWGEKPNACYRITIDNIDFSTKEAIISYSLHEPGEGDLCAQVITQPKAATYVSSQYLVITKRSGAPAATRIRQAEESVSTTPTGKE
jgi:hypothetical protein